MASAFGIAYLAYRSSVAGTTRPYALSAAVSHSHPPTPRSGIPHPPEGIPAQAPSHWLSGRSASCAQILRTRYQTRLGTGKPWTRRQKERSPSWASLAMTPSDRSFPTNFWECLRHHEAKRVVVQEASPWMPNPRQPGRYNLCSSGSSYAPCADNL